MCADAAAWKFLRRRTPMTLITSDSSPILFYFPFLCHSFMFLQQHHEANTQSFRFYVFQNDTKELHPLPLFFGPSSFSCPSSFLFLLLCTDCVLAFPSPASSVHHDYDHFLLLVSHSPSSLLSLFRSALLLFLQEKTQLQGSVSIQLLPHELRISNMRQADTGDYVCTAKNREGVVTATVRISISHLCSLRRTDSDHVGWLFAFFTDSSLRRGSSSPDQR